MYYYSRVLFFYYTFIKGVYLLLFKNTSTAFAKDLYHSIGIRDNFVSGISYTISVWPIWRNSRGWPGTRRRTTWRCASSRARLRKTARITFASWWRPGRTICSCAPLTPSSLCVAITRFMRATTRWWRRRAVRRDARTTRSTTAPSFTSTVNSTPAQSPISRAWTRSSTENRCRPSSTIRWVWMVSEKAYSIVNPRWPRDWWCLMTADLHWKSPVNSDRNSGYQFSFS